MPDPALLATAWRGTVAEMRLRGHVVVASADGRIVAALGDAEAVTTLRSCVKPLQALPFVRGAATAVGADEAELAVACASHDGDTVHVDTVRRLLGRARLDEAQLGCGPQLPFGEVAAQRVLRGGGGPERITNNCSGKHAAMLVTCAVKGWPLEGYLRWEHPCQQAVRDAMGSLMHVPLAEAPWGVDGCGLPTYGVPLAALARSFAAAVADAAFQRCADAMATHPELVAGEGRFDTALLRAAGDRITAKSGAAAVWAAAWREQGLGIAIKLEAGAAEAMPVIALAVLRAIGALPSPVPPLDAMAAGVVRNWEGSDVGRIAADEEAMAALA